MQQKGSQGVRVPTSIRLTDGSILNGTVNCGITGRLETVLNAQDSFIEFMSKAGQRRYISRHQIASVEPLDGLREPALPAIRDDEEAYSVLGLRQGSNADAVRHAFERLSQAYAAEKWASEDIPPEITKYAADKLGQINAAYTLLRGAQTAAQPPAPAEPAKPQGPLFRNGAGTAPARAPVAPAPQTAERRPLAATPDRSEEPRRPDRPLASFVNR